MEKYFGDEIYYLVLFLIPWLIFRYFENRKMLKPKKSLKTKKRFYVLAGPKEIKNDAQNRQNFYICQNYLEKNERHFPANIFIDQIKEIKGIETDYIVCWEKNGRNIYYKSSE